MNYELETDLRKKLVSSAELDGQLNSAEPDQPPGAESDPPLSVTESDHNPSSNADREFSDAESDRNSVAESDRELSDTKLDQTASAQLSGTESDQNPVAERVSGGGTIVVGSCTAPAGSVPASDGGSPSTKAGEATPAGNKDNARGSQPSFDGESTPPRRGPLRISIVFSAILIVAMSVWGNHMAWNKLTKAGVAAAQLHHYAEAEKLLLQALKESERSGHQDRRVATSLSNLAETYRLKGDLDRAEPLQRRALQIRQRLFGENFPDVATSLISIGLLKEDQREFAEAEKCYQRALAIRKTCGSVEDISSVLVQLATLRLNHDEPGAVALFEEALQLQLQRWAFAPDKGRVDEVCNMLGTIYERGNLPTDAYEKWLSMVDRKGLETTFAGLADRFARNKPVAIQEKLYERAATVWQRYFATQKNILSYNRQFFRDWAGLSPGLVYLGRSRYSYSGDHAILAFKRELTMVESSWGSDNPIIAIILNDLAQCKSLSIEQRTAYAERAIRIWKKFVHQNAKLWENKPWGNYVGWDLDEEIANSYLNLVEMHPNKAVAIRQQQQQMWKNEVGLNSEKMAAVYMETAAGLPIAERKILFDKAVATLTKVLLAPATNAVHRELLNEASCLFGSWNWSENGSPEVSRLYMARQQLALFEKAAGSEDYFVGRALNALLESGELTENEKDQVCRRAIEIWRRNIKLITEEDGFSSPLRTFMRYDVGITFDQRSEISKNSESIARQRVAFWEHAFGPFDLSLASALCQLGQIDTLSDAERCQCFERAISIWDKSTSRYNKTNSYSVGNAFNNWSKIGHGRAAASVLRKEAMRLEWKHLNDNSDYASVARDLAKTTADHAEQLRYLDRASSIWLKLMLSDKEKASTYISLLNEAFTSGAAKGTSLAQRIVQQELNFWEKNTVHSSQHMLANLTKLVQIEGLSIELKIQFLERAASIIESQAHLDEEELKAAMGVFDYCAHLHRSINQSQESRFVRQRAAALCDKHSGANTPMMAICLNNLAFSIQQDAWESNTPMQPSDNVVCQNLYQRALGIWQKQVDNQYPGQMQSTLWGLARLSPAKKAEKFYEQALSIKNLLKNDYVNALSKLCLFYCNSGKLEKAKLLCKNALAERTPIKNEVKKLLAALRQQSAAAPPNSNDLNYSDYMDSLNIQIKQNWKAPSGTGAVHVVFKIGTDGRISAVHPTVWSESVPLNQSCIEAIQQGSPFMHLPKGAPNYVTIEYTFSRRIIP